MSADAMFPGDSELAALMRSKNWSTTSLGPVESWPPKLRAAVGIVLTSRFSMWMGWGDDLTFLYNDAYRTDTLGTKHPWALGTPAREVWKEIWADIAPRIASVTTEGRATWDEGLLLMLERSGYREETYHTFSYSPLHDEDGTVRGLLCVVAEETGRLISERRVALLGVLAAELSRSKSEAAVLDGLTRSLASAAHDLPFTLTYMFDAAGTTATLVSTTGFPAHSSQATSIAIGAHAPWSLHEVIETGRPAQIALVGDVWPSGPWTTAPTAAYVVPLARQGQARPAGVLIAGINPHRPFDAPYREFLSLFGGQLAGAIANARAYAAERQRAESLAELDRAKSAFFSNVSHEFRTPLTLMLGPLGGLLTDATVPPEVGEELATVHRNALRLLKLVNTMLDFSRIEAGRAVAQFRPVDLGELTADLASVFRAAIEKAGLRYRVETSSIDTRVLVDRDMWEKIVLNLISNAFKFTLDGEIAVTLVRRGDRVELAVQDSGSGIPEAELPRVFERFHRVAGTKGRTHEGTGIGLALVQELAKLHGGTVAVTSEASRGTTFTVSIPIGDVHAVVPAQADEPRNPQVPDAFVEEAMRWAPASGYVEPVPSVLSTGRQRVLVADDNADMRDYIRRLLGHRWDVETVANGQEALVAIETRRPDLVITDVMMPELDGFGLVATVRANPRLRDLPIVMLSARAGEEARIEGLQAGANDYLVKPFSSRDLIAHVETQLLRAAVRSVEQASAQRLAAIFQQTPVAIAILNGPTHVFEIANEFYLKLVGGRSVLGKTVADALPEVVAQGFIALLDRVYQSNAPFVGRSVRIDLANTDSEPTTFFLDFIYQPLADDAGNITGIAVIAHDVTTLATARESAESANRAKDEFLAMLGHELRNPLAPITTALELMRLRPNVGAERERSVIERQVKHLTGLVDDLLDISRITRGKVELRLVTAEIADIVARAIEVASPLLEEQRHTLTVDVPRGLHVHGDVARLAQAASNLVTNAAKYTPRGGQIAVQAARTGSEITFSVTDNGIGIEPEMLTRVFEPFIQGRQSLDRAKGGLGLGLSIVNNLVKLHGGTVRVHSAGAGQGSRFTVALPALEVPALVATPEPLRGSMRAGRGRLLIVDDNRDAAEMLTEVLAAAGYQIRVAHDGPSALEVARAFRPQVAVLDLGLPVMDGFELARLLSAEAGAGGPKLVALTGYGQADDRSQTQAAGFAAHLVKPVDVDKLRALIDQLLPSREMP